MFPFSIEGRIPVHDETSVEDRLVVRLEDGLNELRALEIVRTRDRIAFRGQMGRGPYGVNYPLSTVTTGEIQIIDGQPRQVEYRLSTKAMAIFNTVMVTLMSPMAAVLGSGPAFAISFCLVGWIWIVGFNYFLTARRVRVLLGSAVGSASPNAYSA